MMMKSRTILTLCVSLFTTSVIAAPLNPADRDYIQSQQQQRLSQDQQQRDALWHAVSPESPPSVASGRNGPCFPVKKIVIRNASLLSERQQGNITAPYINRCLDLTEINALVHDISDWYMQRGYITSRAFLTEQDLSKGELLIPVLEGTSSAGRTWYEADIGINNVMSRAKQGGTRLLYSDDGLLYITTDHYETVTSIGKGK